MEEEKPSLPPSLTHTIANGTEDCRHGDDVYEEVE